MKRIKMTCPNCGADLEADDKDTMICPYCGAELTHDNKAAGTTESRPQKAADVYLNRKEPKTGNSKYEKKLKAWNRRYKTAMKFERIFLITAAVCSAAAAIVFFLKLSTDLPYVRLIYILSYCSVYVLLYTGILWGGFLHFTKPRDPSQNGERSSQNE